MSGYGGQPGPSNSGTGQPSKAKDVQKQVDEVVGIMQDNINKVMERGEKLDALQTKTGTPFAETRG